MRAAVLALFCLIVGITIVRCNIIIALHKIGLRRLLARRPAICERLASLALAAGDAASAGAAGGAISSAIAALAAAAGCSTAASALGRLFTVAENLRHQLLDVGARRQRAEPRHRGRIGEVPVVLGEPLEVADRGIGRPRAAKRRTGKLRRHARREEGADVGRRRDRIERRQAREIEFGLRRGCRPATWRRSSRRARASRSRRGDVVGVRLGGRVGRFALGLDLLARPALQETFRRNRRGPSSLVPSRRGRAASERLRVGPVALALHEHLLDMVLGDEGRNRVAHRRPASAPARRCCCRPRSCPRPRPDRRSRDRARRAARRRFRAAPPTAPASRWRDCRDSWRSRCGAARPSPARHRMSRARRRRRAWSTAACPAGRPARRSGRHDVVDPLARGLARARR